MKEILEELERRRKICDDIFNRDKDEYYAGKAVAYGEAIKYIKGRMKDERQ